MQQEISYYTKYYNTKLSKIATISLAGIWLIDSLNSLNQLPHQRTALPTARYPKQGEAPTLTHTCGIM